MWFRVRTRAFFARFKIRILSGRVRFPLSVFLKATFAQFAASMSRLTVNVRSTLGKCCKIAWPTRMFLRILSRPSNLGPQKFSSCAYSHSRLFCNFSLVVWTARRRIHSISLCSVRLQRTGSVSASAFGLFPAMTTPLKIASSLALSKVRGRLSENPLFHLGSPLWEMCTSPSRGSPLHHPISITLPSLVSLFLTKI